MRAFDLVTCRGDAVLRAVEVEDIDGVRWVNISAISDRWPRIAVETNGCRYPPMDVRCERCRAQYVFDDDQVTPQGLTVQCTNCGHVFRVKKKELVVTVPVRPEDLAEAPMLATAAAPRPHPEAPEQRWTVRQAGGGTLTFTELATLQRWIVERKVGRDDVVSQGDEAWVRLGTIGELSSFFEVVEAADRGRRAVPSSATAPYPPPPVPTGAFPFPPPSVPPAPPPGTPFPPPRASAAPAPAQAGELDAAEPEVARAGRRRGPSLAVAAALLVTAGAAAYVLLPTLGGAPPPPQAAPQPPAPAPQAAPEPVAVPLTVELKPAAPPAEPAQPPEPVAEVAPPKAPVPAPAAAAPRGTKAIMAQARALRDKGQVERALELYGRVASDEPENVDALTGRGLCYLDLGQYHVAEASFRAALQAEPGQPDAIMGLAETYRAQGNKAEALKQFQRYLELHPDGEEAVVARNAISQLKE